MLHQRQFRQHRAGRPTPECELPERELRAAAETALDLVTDWYRFWESGMSQPDPVLVETSRALLEIRKQRGGV